MRGDQSGALEHIELLRQVGSIDPNLSVQVTDTEGTVCEELKNSNPHGMSHRLEELCLELVEGSRTIR